MSNYEIASIVIAGSALLLSIGSFFYTYFLNKKQRAGKVYDKLNKHLALFLDKQFPTAHKKFVVPNTNPPTINNNNASVLDDELSRLRGFLFDYTELIGESQYKYLCEKIEFFENAYLELTNIHSEHNLKEYNKTLSQLKKSLHDFIKKH